MLRGDLRLAFATVKDSVLTARVSLRAGRLDRRRDRWLRVVHGEGPSYRTRNRRGTRRSVAPTSRPGIAPKSCSTFRLIRCSRSANDSWRLKKPPFWPQRSRSIPRGDAMDNLKGCPAQSPKTGGVGCYTGNCGFAFTFVTTAGSGSALPNDEHVVVMMPSQPFDIGVGVYARVTTARSDAGQVHFLRDR